MYIYPYAFWGSSNFLLNFIRISNYLNSRKKELNGKIKEEYLDLRFENLSNFVPNNIENYRNELKKLLKGIYRRFKFNLVAISCYTSYTYINSVEVAIIIKKFINPSCIIVVGGVHATICPEDFQPRNLPEYLYDKYPQLSTPFDYLIRDEGEIPFFKLIQSLLKGTIKYQKTPHKSCIILKIEMIKNLDELPIIDLKLFEKYKTAINNTNKLYLDFSRGCMYRCKFCTNSENYINSYKIVRLKSIKKCIEELKVIKNTKWLSIKNLHIVDMIFIPKKSKREQFFYELEKIFEKEGSLPFKIQIYERIEFCSKNDLRNYKRFNITPYIGFESCSKKLLFRMGKLLGKNDEQIKKGIDRYLIRAEEIIQEGNELNIPIVFYYLIGLPGADKETINESRAFFLKKRFDGKALIEKYKINLDISKYVALFGSEIYNNAEKKYGAKIYYKKWWKLFTKNQPYYAALVDPNKDLSLLELFNLSYDYIKQIFYWQSKLNNPHFSFQSYLLYKTIANKISKLYEKKILKS
ncbi:MAG: B12-binding domain-containing radical SAM protein [Promethearchaeota archaeon]